MEGMVVNSQELLAPLWQIFSSSFVVVVVLRPGIDILAPHHLEQSKHNNNIHIQQSVNFADDIENKRTQSVKPYFSIYIFAEEGRVEICALKEGSNKCMHITMSVICEMCEYANSSNTLVLLYGYVWSKFPYGNQHIKF